MSTLSFSEKHLHLVSFDIPVPVNYGGAIDIFYKVKSLSEAGIRIHLHCFQYGRDPAMLLEKYCESVHYYTRDLSGIHFFHSLPFIVKTRASAELLKLLVEQPYPILFEGLHSCIYLDHPALANRRKVVRTHNIEHDYYANLGRVEKNLLKKLYFFEEARKLRKFEKILTMANGVAAISRKDQSYFNEKYPGHPIENISAFHPFQTVEYHEGIGQFALYHGSLEVGENNQAALFLIREIFQGSGIPLVIAGNKPSGELIEVAGKYSNVTLKGNLTTEDIYHLVREAQVNILPTFQATGIKLKLLSALYIGRHCIVNQPMVENTGLETLCHILNTPDEMKKGLENLLQTPYRIEETVKREKVFREMGFTNEANAAKLIRLLFPG
ncbi:MAG: glycosyltransferase [Bacteroidetes bacterium]|nr:glycosyltransferase [Bacteroidota bacterium]